jgi:hypothetical protein
MTNRLFFFALLFALILDAVAVQSQQLTIQLENGKQIVLTRADIEALPHSKVATGTFGDSTAFEGVTLKALLDKAGAGLGEPLKGKRMSSCLLVEAADGYRVVIALPETDPAFTDKQIILAFLKNGKPLDDKEGPYRIVITDEKKMARWVKQVTTVRIVDVQ